MENATKMTREQAIMFCRADSSRRNNVLHWAQEFCPLAYAEWNKSNKWNGFKYHFQKFMIFYDSKGYPITEQQMFEIREKQLK